MPQNYSCTLCLPHSLPSPPFCALPPPSVFFRARISARLRLTRHHLFRALWLLMERFPWPHVRGFGFEWKDFHMTIPVSYWMERASKQLMDRDWVTSRVPINESVRSSVNFGTDLNQCHWKCQVLSLLVCPIVHHFWRFVCQCCCY